MIAEIPACNSTILHPGVQEVIPPERLLVYNWSDGWAPLAHFLGTAIPEDEFPHEDSLELGVTIQAAASAAVAYELR